MPITINVDIDNVGKIDSVKEDKGIIDKHGTHMMPLAWVINRGHLL
jgi:broad-specificity NMP kinase